MLHEVIVMLGERNPRVDQDAVVSVLQGVPFPPVLEILAVFLDLGGSNQGDEKPLSEQCRREFVLAATVQGHQYGIHRFLYVQVYIRAHGPNAGRVLRLSVWRICLALLV
jgi:hypothetical protein